MKISDEVIKILEFLCDKIGFTIDWTSNNVLPYLEQLCEKFIKWEINTSYAWIAIMCCAIVFTFIFSMIVWKTCDWDNFEWVIFVGVVVISIIVIGIQIFDIIQCNTIPEKVIYDYIREHMTNNTYRQNHDLMRGYNVGNFTIYIQ